jgi:hypothetical protein
MDGGEGGAPAASVSTSASLASIRPVITQCLRCQMTQNQSMAGELGKALRRIAGPLQVHAPTGRAPRLWL